MNYNIPKKKYVAGEKKMISWRLPKRLIAELEKNAKKKQWTVTDLVTTILDQYLQSEEKKKSK